LGARLLAHLTMPDAPHFDHPLAFETRPDGTVALATIEQGSREHVRAQIARVVSFPIKTRNELPEFGITPLVFQRGGINLAVLRAQVERWVDADISDQELVDVADMTRRTVQITAGS
jgi:hypothetical protein